MSWDDRSYPRKKEKKFVKIIKSLRQKKRIIHTKNAEISIVKFPSIIIQTNKNFSFKN